MSSENTTDSDNSNENDSWIPQEAIAWLKRMSRKNKFGVNNYEGVLNVIRSLLQDRVTLNKEVQRLEKEIARLQTKPTKSHYGIEGQGQWGH